MLRDSAKTDLDAHAAISRRPGCHAAFRRQPIRPRGLLAPAAGGVGLWQLRASGLLAVERKSDGKLVGHVGLFDYHREMTRSIEGAGDGLDLRDRGPRAGACRRSVRAVLDWADGTFDAGLVWRSSRRTTSHR